MSHPRPIHARRPIWVPLIPLLLAGCSAVAPAPTVERHPISPAEALESFDAAWEIIHEQHFDETFNGVDWPALREELRPRVEAAEDLEELRTLIREMLGRLEQSHFGLLTDQEEEGSDEIPEEQEAGPGLDIRIRDGRALVTEVYEEGPAWVAGVRLGWILVEVGDRAVEDAFKGLDDEDPRHVRFQVRRRVLGRLYGPDGSALSMTFLDEQDERQTIDLERRLRDVLVSKFGNLPTFYLRFHSVIHERDGARIGLIHFSNWFLPVARPIDEAVDRMRDCDAVVIDLRGNSGGALGLVLGVAGHFLDDRRELGSHIMRGNTLTYRANPRRVNTRGERVVPFLGPLAILVDETSGSASEVFSGSMQAVGRARVFGETSIGAVLPARTSALPNGDVLLHAMADFVTADGTRLEGRGVVPDEEVPLRREDLVAGEDAQLEAALRWLAAARTTEVTIDQQ